ncbi:MAG: cytochrome c peroxidase [Caldilineales bacterium]
MIAVSGNTRSVFIALMGSLVAAVVLAACAPATEPAATAIAPATATSAPTATSVPIFAPQPSPTWSPLRTPPDNPSTPAKIELGRQLFYDPALSAGNDMSCATCHHPDRGFSNGAAVSDPRPGAPPRNVSGLWNTGFNAFLLWDGRETSLESQARLPLTLPNEMAETPDMLEAKLRAIPAYVDLFDAAFSGGVDAVTFDNVTRALAAFQRTLISDDSPYDRFVAGDEGALTEQQQRGMDLFFSERTHCGECHQPPLLANETFRVTGVPSNDPGRAGVSERGLYGAFKVPSLRNVALTAPYMHAGQFATLEEVVQFYADGAGRANGFPRVDPMLRGFDLTADEKADLVAFLNALTDESRLPPVPDVALSGLPTVPRIQH